MRRASVHQHPPPPEESDPRDRLPSTDVVDMFGRLFGTILATLFATDIKHLSTISDAAGELSETLKQIRNRFSGAAMDSPVSDRSRSGRARPSGSDEEDMREESELAALKRSLSEKTESARDIGGRTVEHSPEADRAALGWRW
jgi:hypothetical protein